jgi:predicted permease
MLDALWYDAHYALRGFRRRPGFTAVIVATLALGIGANTTMFGLLDRLLLEAPGHIADPDRVVLFNIRWPGLDGAQTSQPYAMRTVLAQQVSDFADVAAATPTAVVHRTYYPVGRGPTATRVAGALVDANYFSLLGVQPALGRFFLPDEETVARPQKLAVLGYGYWQRQYAGRRDVIGQTIDVGVSRYTIVGVTPAGFTGTEMRDVDVWLPIVAADGLRFDNSPDWTTSGGSQWLLILARLKPGARVERAEAQATVAFRNWERHRIATSRFSSPAALARVDSEFAVLGSIIPGKSPWKWGLSGSDSDVNISKLLGAVSLMVLLIACANVANLLLVRALGRRREIAVRLALGVSRRRLIEQLVTEGMLLAVMGAIGALIVTALATPLVRTWLIGEGAWSGGTINARVLAFNAGVALVTGIVTALVPALQTSRPDLTSALKSGSREGAIHRSRTRTGLLIMQAALAIVLLAGAGMFIRSLQKVAALDLGVEVDHVLVGQINHSVAGLSNEEAHRLYDQFAERTRTLPGVTASAVSVGLPFNLSWGARVSIPGRELPQKMQQTYQYAITPDYFKVMGIRLRSGRAFTTSDREGTAPVAIVNETMARRLWPNQSPIGACVRVGGDTMPCATVVGVVTNTRRQDLVEDAISQVYRPLDQLSPAITGNTVSFFGYTLVVRTSGDAANFAEPVRQTIQSVGASVPYANVQTIRSLLGRHTRAWELGARVFSAFGALALLLAAIGLFSVVAFTIGQRTHEFGVRAALGAQRGDLLRLGLVRGLAPAAAGVVIGVLVALAAGRFVASLLFDVSPRDPMVLSLASGLLLVASIAAALVPAMRASRVDPTVALRAE